MKTPRTEPKTKVDRALLSDWEEAAELIVKTNQDDHAKMTPNILISHFLTPMSEQKRAEVSRNWIIVAGHTSRPIDILGFNNTILGTLPPLSSPIVTQYPKHEQEDLAVITEEAAKHAAFWPKAGDQYLEKGFRHRGFKSNDVLKSMIIWNHLAEMVDGPIPFKEVYQATKVIMKEDAVAQQAGWLSEEDDEL